jgi:hypothetical protein
VSAGVQRTGAPGFRVGTDAVDGSWYARVTGAETLYELDLPGGATASIGQSVNVTVKWAGWNTSASVEFRFIDGSAQYAGAQGRVAEGLYIRSQPLKMAAIATGAIVVWNIGGAIVVLAPELEPWILGVVERLLPKIPEFVPSGG